MRPAPATRLPGAVGAGGQSRLFELLLTVVERLVAAGPVVLVFEDLHWADRSTLDLVAVLASTTRALPVCTIGTYRIEDVPPRHPLRQLTAELTRRGAQHLELARLGPGEVAELLGALLGEAPTPEVTASVVERSDGNPLFVEELAAGLAADPGAPMPPHLHDAVVSRVERMPAGAAAVLRACAVGGREVEHDLLTDVVIASTAGGVPAAAGGDPGALDRDLRTCVESRLLLADQERATYRFRHALVHEAVLADVLPGELHRLHAGLRHRARRAPTGRGAGPGRPVVVAPGPALGGRRRLRRRARRRGAGRAGGRGRVRRARGPALARVERAPVGPGRTTPRPPPAAAATSCWRPPPTPPTAAGWSCGR